MSSRDEVVIGFAVGGGVLGGLAALFAAALLAKKRHVEFFSDATRRDEVMRVFQDQKIVLLRATFTVADKDLNLVGWMEKNYLHDIFRKRWRIFGADGQLLAVALEDSIWRAVVRRIARDYVPLMRTNFIILTPDRAGKLGEFNRRFTITDKYVLDMTSDVHRVLDRRLAVAMAVLLDTAEKR